MDGSQRSSIFGLFGGNSSSSWNIQDIEWCGKPWYTVYLHDNWHSISTHEIFTTWVLWPSSRLSIKLFVTRQTANNSIQSGRLNGFAERKAEKFSGHCFVQLLNYHCCWKNALCDLEKCKKTYSNPKVPDKLLSLGDLFLPVYQIRPIWSCILKLQTYAN